MKQRTEKEYNFLWTYLTEHGLTDSEATEALRLDSIVRIDSARRTYNEVKDESEKDRVTQEKMRKQFDPIAKQVTSSIHERARMIREEKEKNLQLF